MCDVIRAMKEEASRIEWDTIYSSKGHFNAAMLWNCVHTSLGLLAVILALMAGNEFAGSNDFLGSTLAFLAAAFSAVITFLRPSEKADPHKKAGDVFVSLRRKARMFQEIEILRISDTDDLNRRLELLAEELKQANEKAPAIPFLAYQIARWGIRRGEAGYDEEGERK